MALGRLCTTLANAMCLDVLRVSIQERLHVIPSFVFYLRQVGAQSLGQEETEPRGQHGTISLGRNSEDLGFYHLAKLHLPAHTQPTCFLPPFLQQSVLGFFARKMAKRTLEILLKQARR